MGGATASEGKEESRRIHQRDLKGNKITEFQKKFKREGLGQNEKNSGT